MQPSSLPAGQAEALSTLRAQDEVQACPAEGTTWLQLRLHLWLFLEPVIRLVLGSR